MAKDPAFLFYPNDWIGGTMGMTFEEKGAYIELLMLQFNRGHMGGHMIAQVLGQSNGQIWDKIKDKFDIDDNGLYFNKRLEEEQEKRKLFTISRKNNLEGINQYSKNNKKQGHKTKHMSSHMENENEDENINRNKEEKERQIEFENFRKNFPGTKRGFKIEYDNLKKHKDWMQVIAILNERLNYQISMRTKKEQMKQFIPEWKNLKTWINQRCWEEEITIQESMNNFVSYKELLRRRDNGEEDIFDRYEIIRPGDKLSLWRPKIIKK